MGTEFFSDRTNVNQGTGETDWSPKNNYRQNQGQGFKEHENIYRERSAYFRPSRTRPVNERHPDSAAFLNLLTEMLELHDRKQKDYGTSESPFANVRASEDLGVEPWIGGLIRMNDKMRRLHKAANGGQMANESVEDSLLDLAVYAVITLILYKETNND